MSDIDEIQIRVVKPEVSIVDSNGNPISHVFTPELQEINIKYQEAANSSTVEGGDRIIFRIPSHITGIEFDRNNEPIDIGNFYIVLWIIPIATSMN